MQLLLDKVSDENWWEIAKVDPNLFDAAGLEIDDRISRDDITNILGCVRDKVRRHTYGTRIFQTDDGQLGTGLPPVQFGDFVCIIYGSSVPQILRPVDDAGHYTSIGECHVDGLMYGEALERNLLEQEFILV